MKNEKADKGKVHSLEFRPAKGGIISRTVMAHKRGGHGGGPDYDHSSEERVHPDMDSAKAHLESTMGSDMGKKGEE